MPITPNNPFKGRQHPGEVIILCVRWYLRYPLSYEHVAELVAERGVEVDASCIWRWVQAYAPELNKRCRPHLKPTNKSYRIDETYIKVKGEDKYLYRALDSTGQTIDFLLTAKRDTAAANASAQGYRRVGQSDAAGDERGQEPGISGCGGSAESRWQHSPPGRFTPVQVSQQLDRTGPPDSKETSLAGQRLWFVSERVADVTGNRNRANDPEGPSEMAGKRGCGRPGSLHRRVVRPRCLAGITIDDSCWLDWLHRELRNETSESNGSCRSGQCDEPALGKGRQIELTRLRS
jgi:DDE domain